MDKGRLEAFSDGVIAIIITIMVLEMKVPHGENWASLVELWPVFLSYVMSFLYVGAYWNNRHHLLQAARSVSGGVLWANLHLLFWLSLMPFTTGWMGENHFAALPTLLYGAMAAALGRDWKGKISIGGYALGMILAWLWRPQAGVIIFMGVPLLWLVPDRRMAAVAANHTHTTADDR